MFMLTVKGITRIALSLFTSVLMIGQKKGLLTPLKNCVIKIDDRTNFISQTQPQPLENLH
jgi:hypothetical protein